MRWRDAGWPTYSAAKQAFRSMIRRVIATGGGSEVGDVPADYDEMLDWLVRGHPDAQALLERGVSSYTIVPTGRPAPGQWGLAVVDIHGGVHPFSTHEALTGMRRSPRSTLNHVMAVEVSFHLELAAAQGHARGERCPMTGEPITADNAVADYRLGSPMLEGLVSGFLKSEGLEVEDVQLRCNGRLHEDMLVDRELASRWRDYHGQHAKLEALTVRGHELRQEQRRDNPFHGMST